VWGEGADGDAQTVQTNDDADVQRGKRFGALITLKHVADLSVVGIVRGGTLTVGHRHKNETAHPSAMSTLSTRRLFTMCFVDSAFFVCLGKLQEKYRMSRYLAAHSA
jgi:hypothetical protein